MSIGDIHRLTIEMHFSDAPIEINHVLWFREVSDHGSVGADYLAADFVANVATSGYRAQQANQVVWDAVVAQRMTPTVDAPVAVSYVGIHGTGGANAGAPFAAALATMDAARPGRSGTGRLYLGGMNRDAFFGVSGLWASAVLASLQAFPNAVLARYSETNLSIQFRWGVWSKKIGNRRAPFDAAGFSPIDTVAMDGVMRLQRSREYGVSRAHAGRH